jgi:hypothetical protein
MFYDYISKRMMTMKKTKLINTLKMDKNRNFLRGDVVFYPIHPISSVAAKAVLAVAAEAEAI